MMFKNYALFFLSIAFPLATTSALPKPGSTVTRKPCWAGQIHYPCDGSTTGCTPDGIMVKCQDSSGAMIYANMCDLGSQGKGTCTYDADCNAACSA
ncbi:uncharacterized protein F4817DRAFT_328431 [Daldinia loculata]|uniref:uncharacterized protein n=1 Tax=Daldinia loculata TaxID=103429 RepID=UPI0020C41E79|nr:uncharacterized protein F4817DRAFT_328431 [Daldinia loculata]KAI1650158.1 hypothetical protein F4817DRAFT_328431 [Daldinia loculata]